MPFAQKPGRPDDYSWYLVARILDVERVIEVERGEMLPCVISIKPFKERNLLRKESRKRRKKIFFNLWNEAHFVFSEVSK